MVYGKTVQGTNGTYTASWTALLAEYKERVARISWGILLCPQGTYCANQGESPWSSPFRSDGSWDYQAGESGPCYRRLRASKLTQKTIRLKSTQIRWFLWSPGSRLVRVNGGRIEGLHSLRKLKWELENNTGQPRDLTKNRQNNTLNKSWLNLSRWVLMKGELVSMKMMTMGENQSSWSQVHVTVILGTD